MSNSSCSLFQLNCVSKSQAKSSWKAEARMEVVMFGEKAAIFHCWNGSLEFRFINCACQRVLNVVLLKNVLHVVCKTEDNAQVQVFEVRDDKNFY
mmetsp:Transcript_100511/g.216855  ORF Transcript_100511/g.216855 Transcript_100511/m.216855 type:complete len:95 (-) Transcript_100511:1293-1577(-)